MTGRARPSRREPWLQRRSTWGLGLALVILAVVGTLSFGGYLAAAQEENPYAARGGDIRVLVKGGDAREAETTHALAYWENGEGAEIDWRPRFVVVASEPADIVVTYTPARTVACGIGPLTVQAAGCGGLRMGKGFAEVGTAGRLPREVEDILKHELGHALGLLHSKDPEHVMHSSVEGLPWWARWLNHPWR